MDLDLDQIYDSDAASLRTALRALDDYIAARLLPEVEIARMRRQHGLIQLELEERSANEAIIAPLGRPRPPGISSSSSTGGDMAAWPLLSTPQVEPLPPQVEPLPPPQPLADRLMAQQRAEAAERAATKRAAAEKAAASKRAAAAERTAAQSRAALAQRVAASRVALARRRSSSNTRGSKATAESEEDAGGRNARAAADATPASATTRQPLARAPAAASSPTLLPTASPRHELAAVPTLADMLTIASASSSAVARAPEPADQLMADPHHCDDRPDDSGASAAGPRMPFVPAVATANEGAHCEAPTSQEDSMGATFGATTEEKPRTRVAADLPLATVSGRAEARLVPIHAQTAGDRMLLRPATAGAPPPPDASEVRRAQPLPGNDARVGMPTEAAATRARCAALPVAVAAAVDGATTVAAAIDVEVAAEAAAESAVQAGAAASRRLRKDRPRAGLGPRVPS